MKSNAENWTKRTCFDNFKIVRISSRKTGIKINVKLVLCWYAVKQPPFIVFRWYLSSIVCSFQFYKLYMCISSRKYHFIKVRKKKIVNIWLFFTSIWLNDSHDHNQSNMPDNIIFASRVPSHRIHLTVISHEILNVHLKVLEILKSENSKISNKIRAFWQVKAISRDFQQKIRNSGKEVHSALMCNGSYPC